MTGSTQAVTLHRAHAGDQEQIAGGHDLAVAGGAASARQHPQLAARIAPRDRRLRCAAVKTPVGDQRLQSGAAQTEHREQILGEMLARRSVAEQQLHAIRPRHAQPIELVDVCRKLHQSGDAGAAGQLAVLHDPAAGLVTREEVREPDELIGRESGLVDDVRVGCESRVRVGHCRGQSGGIRRPRRGDLDDAVAVLLAVVGEHAKLVLAAEQSGAFERGVFGLFDCGDAPEAGVDRTQPRELALGCGLEIARAPDDARLSRNVSQWFPFVPPIVRAGADSAARSGEPMEVSSE